MDLELNLDEQTKADLERIAAVERTSVEAVIRAAIRDYLARNA